MIGHGRGGKGVAIGPLKGSVNLYFDRGVDPSNQEGLLTSAGKEIRHIKVREAPDAIRAEPFEGLIRQAAKLVMK